MLAVGAGPEAAPARMGAPSPLGLGNDGHAYLALWIAAQRLVDCAFVGKSACGEGEVLLVHAPLGKGLA